MYWDSFFISQKKSYHQRTVVWWKKSREQMQLASHHRYLLWCRIQKGKSTKWICITMKMDTLQTREAINSASLHSPSKLIAITSFSPLFSAFFHIWSHQCGCSLFIQRFVYTSLFCKQLKSLLWLPYPQSQFWGCYLLHLNFVFYICTQWCNIDLISFL